MSCGGPTKKNKMAVGGTTTKRIIKKSTGGMYGIPQENLGTSGQYGFGQKGGTIKKMQDGGIFTPHGRIKSKKTRDISLSSSGNSTNVSRTKRNGDIVTKSINTSNGYGGTTADKTKTITNKAGETVSNKTKNISAKSADRKINRVINNVGRNANDTWAYKKGGATKATKLAAVAPPKNKVTRADVLTRILKKKTK